jgi:hypothetical protein
VCSGTTLLENTNGEREELVYLTTSELIELHRLLIKDAREYVQASQNADPINIIINFFKKLFGRR